MAVYVGIDVHKRFCQAAMMDEAGRIQRELRFDNTLEGTSCLVNLARSIDPHVKAVVEPSANYWIKVYDRLEDEGVEVTLSNPLRTKAIAEAKVKMDKLDAKMLAYLLRGDLVAESYVPTRKNRERRTLIRHRASLLKMRVEVKNRIHALLDKHDLPYDYSDLFGKEGIEWLRNLNLPSIDQQILRSNLQILETLNSEIQNADIQIAKDAVNEEQAKLLMTMPGVDYYAAMILLSEIGDVKRFASPEKLASWVGLAPQVHQSGETQWTGHIAKKRIQESTMDSNPMRPIRRITRPYDGESHERIERKHGYSKTIVVGTLGVGIKT